MKNIASPQRFLAILVVGLLAVSFGCGSKDRTVDPDEIPRPGDFVRQSPLGVGHPDPEIMLDAATRAARAGETRLWLSYFAYNDPATGEPFVGDLERMQLDEPSALKMMSDWAAQTIMTFDPRLVTIRYSSPVNIQNTPPTEEVRTDMATHAARLSPAEADRLTAEVNALQSKEALSFDQIKGRLEAMPAVGRMRFVYLDNAWRFDARRPGEKPRSDN